MRLKVHKDFADAFENARAQVFPLSRAVDCFFHFMEKQKTIMAKCKKLLCNGRGFVKEHHGLIVHGCNVLREAPTAELFSVLWQGFLGRMVALGEDVVAQYLRKEYTIVVPSQVVQQRCSRAPWQIEGFSEYAWMNIWDGLFGIFPGTASSNNSLEVRLAASRMSLMWG